MQSPRVRLRPRWKFLRYWRGEPTKKCWRLEHQDKGVWLSDCEASLLLCVIMNKNAATTDLISEALWPDPDFMPDAWDETLKVHRCRVNKKLRKVGWQIGNIRDHIFGLFPYSSKPVQFEDERPFEWLT